MNPTLNEYEQLHLEKMRTIAPECTVLLKHNGAFPLKAAGEIALYGSGARNTLKGGSGSGDVNSRFYTTCEQGLETAGFTVTTKAWLDGYDSIRANARRQFIADIKRRAKEQHVQAVFLGMGAVMREPAYDLPLAGRGDTAVYVLARSCGEGNDRKLAEGDFKLTSTEIRDILACKKKYPRFLLVLNVGGVVDLSPVMEVENILLLSQLGAVTGGILAELILGKSCPSGKLTDTWCAAEKLPAIGEFGCRDDTRYREGVYVGYRYFDSVRENVLFPFGYGLSYTAFSIDKISPSLEGRTVTVTARVVNTGAYPGREVLQLYATAPWGRLDHPYQVLAGFAKTSLLPPGASEELSISVQLEALASYDSEQAAYILEKGKYLFRLGTSSRDTVPCFAVRMLHEITIRRLTNVGGKTGFSDWKPAYTWADAADGVPAADCGKDAFSSLSWPAPHKPSRRAMELVKKLSEKDLCSLCVGKHKKGLVMTSVIGNASQSVAGAAGESYGSIPGLRSLVMADGPAGLRLNQQYTRDKKGVHPIGETMPAGISDFLPSASQKLMSLGANRKPKGTVYYQYCTAIPIGTAIAQSWNPEVGKTCGDVVGREMEIFGVDLWLAPAFNLHRNPLCGRNFEYYSEDPLLSGIFGAALTEGVQLHPGKGVSIKHFCVNNQETNRYQTNSLVNERALREIYLKGFEICVTTARPKALMTSYNLLNGTHTAEHKDLLKTILREEWGFDGLVMTDWIVTGLKDKKSIHRTTQTAPSIAAGNDLFMPGDSGNYKQLLSALRGKHKTFSVSRESVELCAAHLVDLLYTL